MPFKRKDSPYYQVRKWNLPGYGDTGAISSGTSDKAAAVRMENVLVDLANRALIDPTWRNLLDAICEHDVALADALTAKNLGKLGALKMSLTDPLISEAIAEYKQASKLDKSVRLGLLNVDKLAGPERLGTLTGKRITEICHQAEREFNQKRNTVHRQVKRAISLLLRFHLGNAERNRIFSDVNYEREDDTREVHLSPAEIARLLQACDDLNYSQVSVLIRLALLTSADRGTLLPGISNSKMCRGMLRRDVEIYQGANGIMRGEVFIYDTKTTGRSRTVPITDALCRELLVMCRDKAPDAPVFDITYQQLDFLWKRIRRAAGFWNQKDGYTLRFKDLRAQTAIYGEEAGIPQTVISRTLGHANERMTRRYQQRAAAMSAEQARELERRMFGAGSGARTNRNINAG